MIRTTSLKSARRLLAAGLLIGALTQLLSRFVPMPDILIGLFLGIGIGIEILSLVMFGKLKRQKS